MDAIPLTPIVVNLNDSIFNEIVTWKFEDEFVSRILLNDIPQRLKYASCQMWAYADPERNLVGFGTLDVCKDCSEFSDDQLHTYIPLLAVDSSQQGRGHGKLIVNHLVKQAACVVAGNKTLHHAVFLDVYENSTAAIGLYTKCGFTKLDGPFVDSDNDKTFLIMAQRVTPA